ncbi:hypothetical protein CK203_060610 [Vitis vinifera]|uniref:Retrotransposon Copia-like N-terminal domain-containing protein n=1 Tax=Vitis vinifera TaxID=29760 RepID=A0A438GBX3_VITVI|nr:hypothetical protein CK203_060610 [Vitis vinifera]
MKALSRLILKAQEGGFISGFTIGERGGDGEEISHLLFANDTIIFCKASQQQVTHLCWLLMWFEAMSRLKINLEESEVIPIGEVDLLEELACEIGCKVGKLPSFYLGLPLGASHKFVAVWDGVEERFQRRLSLWKRHYLSKGGRLTLLRSTLPSLPIYFMSLFTIPRFVKLRRIKFWKDRWCSEEPLCEIFPSLFALSDSKEAWLVDLWEHRGEGGNWNFRFVRNLNDWELGAMERFLSLLQGHSVKRNKRIKWFGRVGAKGLLCEFLNLGGLLGKYFGFGSASRKGMDLAQQMCFMQSGVRDHGSYPSSLCQGKIIMAASVLHFWCLAIIHSGQISLAISQSDHLSLWHLSFRSSVPSQSQGRKRFPVGRIVVRKHSPPATFPANFSGELSGDGFFLHRKERLEEISNLSQSTGTRNPSTRRHARFSGRRLHLTRRRVRAREPLSGDALPPPGSPDADQPPFLPVLHPSPARASFGVLLLPRALDQFSGVLRLFFLNSNPCTCLGKCSSTFPVHDKIRNGIITRHKLNGHNYLQWSQSVLLFICGKGKDEYLTGEAVMPETTEPGFRKWKIENSMIMSWLINSMNNDIGENFLLFGTAKDIWDAAKETYSSSENTSELFRYWQQLDLFETHSWKCSDDAATYRQIVEQKRLFKFFLGLNRELDDVRGRIMGIKPLPSLREAFSEVRREESRKKVMMGSKSNLPQHWMPLPLLLGHLIVVVEIVRNGIGLGVIIVRNQAIIRRLAGSFMANR